MYDLSVDGCMIEALEGSFAEGDVLSIEFEQEIGAEGEVVWQRENCMGIRFFKRLHPVIVQYLGFVEAGACFGSFDKKPPRDKSGRLFEDLPVQEDLFSNSCGR